MVLISLLPAFLAVLSLIIGARDVPVRGERTAPRFLAAQPGPTLRSLPGHRQPVHARQFVRQLPRPARSEPRHLGLGILLMIAMFNLIYSLISTPAGRLSDRIGRRRLIVGGWLVYAAIYFGFALARAGWQVWLLYVVYGLYYGMAFGSANALVADLVPGEPARHRLWHLQRRHRPAGVSSFPDRRHPLAGHRRLARVSGLRRPSSSAAASP